MIRLSTELPRKRLYIACSGGVDSMVLLDFVIMSKREVTVLHINHGTEYGKLAEQFIKRKCAELNLELMIKTIANNKPLKKSKEEFWREERYAFFKNVGGPVLTAHHLNDAVEWWVFSSCHGNPKLIPICNENIIRPFLITPKSELLNWAKRKNVEYVEDPSNKDTSYLRNLIRHDMMPSVLKINPGLKKTIKKKYLELSS